MEEVEVIRAVELFSGIGGFHWALKESDQDGEVITAADINTVANAVYKHNFPDVELLNRNVQQIQPTHLIDRKINTVFMSPPCQPFTRVGLKKDTDDARCNALVDICHKLKDMTSIKFIILENVKGFESSEARELFISSIAEAGFEYQEFILSPREFGVPNTRNRYYCVARRDKPFSFKQEEIMTRYPGNVNDTSDATSGLVKEYLEKDCDIESLLLPDNVALKRIKVIDIVTPDSPNSQCFTKAYTHYAEGTGSIYCPQSKEQLDNTRKLLEIYMPESKEYNELIKSLQLRYFSPREVANLMCFPKEFQFTEKTTRKQSYRLLGNSINVKVVSRLINLLNET